MIFERKYYLNQLIRGIGNGMVKIVTGIRRCGKSFLLFNIFRNYLLQNGVAENHIIGLSLDDVVNRESARYYIQSAYALPSKEKIQQELRSLLNIDDSFKKIVVVYDDILPYHTDSGVLIVGLKQFLSNSQIIDF